MFARYVPVDFRLPNKNQTWRLMRFIPSDVLSGLDWLPDQIDILADYLNWDIMSSRELPGEIFVKYAHKIDWRIFLLNQKPKEINFLLDVKDKLADNADIFFSSYVKNRYYTEQFVLVFPNLIDWKWLIKHKQIPEYTLLKFYDKFTARDIAKYQTITPTIASQKLDVIDWYTASKRPLSEEVMMLAGNRLHFPFICRYQKNLSEEFVTKHYAYICWSEISKYQRLSESFIRKYRKRLDLVAISQYQNLSYDFIKEFEQYLDLTALSKNTHYNKKDTIQVLRNTHYCFIIDTPSIGKMPPVQYLTGDMM